MKRGFRGVTMVVAVLASIGLSAIIPALAARTNLGDANDSPGPLDLRHIRFDQDAGPASWALHTFGSWTVDDIQDSGFVLVILDTLGSPDEDYLVVVRSDGPKLVGLLLRRRTGGRDTEIGRVRVAKSGADGVTMTVDMGKLNFGPTRTLYFWWVLSQFTGKECPRTCLDRAPEERAVQQKIPSPSPTPTPSPSPTDSPTPSPSP
ncbi:MAG: hypothetical protein ACRDH0_05810 [Actinomycetota bacterium]